MPYVRSARMLRQVSQLDDAHFADWSRAKLTCVVRRGFQSVPYYRERFSKHGYQDDVPLTADRFARLPISTKDDLRQTPLADRTCPESGMLSINTGGTSGSPLSFSVDRSAFAREWAHMHFVWQRAGYRPQDTKLTLRGRRWDGPTAVRFNAVHNEWIVNASAPMQSVIDWIASMPQGEISWVHGYPSLVAELGTALEQADSGLTRKFRVGLQGVLLGSEYPAAIYRDVIERVMSSNVVSWYGHSEMAVLAWESARGIYQPLPSYGFTEIVFDHPDDDAGRLVVTSYDNHVHPFIRYDTGDRVSRVDGPDGCPSFRVSEGRVGEFIEDANGQRHSLTAIIFGRHHRAFDEIRHVQVEDLGAGNARLLIVPVDSGADSASLRRGFDLDDLPIDWRIELINQPVRTESGKTPLKVSGTTGSCLSNMEP